MELMTRSAVKGTVDIADVAVIPASVVDEAVALAFAKFAAEDRARDDLREGALLSEVWARYKVL